MTKPLRTDDRGDVFLSTLIANLTFDHLSTFKAIVEARSFRGAAEKLAMSQAAVSQRVKHLEGMFGVTLFDRQQGGRARLTQAGERVLALAESLFREVEQFHRELGVLRRPRAGDRLVVAAGPSFIKYRLLPAVRTFNKRYPDVEVQLRHSLTPDEVLSLVLSGEADLGIYVGHPPDGQVRSFPLAEDRLILVAPPGHPILRSPVSRRLADLSRIPFAISSYAAHSRQLIEGWANHHGIVLKIKIEADNLDTLKEAVLQGVVLAVLPDFAVARELHDGTLAAVETPGLPLGRRVNIIGDARHSLSVTLRTFVRLLSEIYPRQSGSRLV